MGSSNSTPAATPAAGGCPVNHGAGPSQAAAPEAGQGCPVQHGDAGAAAAAPPAGCPVKHEVASPPPSGCPVDHGQGGDAKKTVYNVYAQPIDPSNRMPLNPNQLPAPGQTKPLSTDRVRSHIPKGGADGETWEYPSAQMFYNAMMRKGKLEDDVSEDDVATIVAVHNNMNEKTWHQVVQWEKALHPEDFAEADGIRLTRFMGRPNDISPMAWVKSTFLGYPKPFDRHDWIVDRNGREVRYVIDYYYDESKSSQDETPELHDIRSIKSITMDARPAVDSPQSLFDRIRFPLMEKFDMVPPIDMGLKSQEAEKAAAAKALIEKEPLPEGATTFEKMDVDELRDISSKIGPACKACFAKVDKCSSEAECQQASVALTFCMAELVCSKEAQRFQADLNSEERLDEMVACMDRFEERALKLRQIAAATAAATATAGAEGAKN
ncbi:Cytochrome c-type heme lyase [Hondaea fermentalgiana]|uniref:Holocytochrome c-type synthase n=1 Tax=Hondaea fermentalgiana TaxID=2315210 RepID=A0A2R5GFG1_9STRA|nr:Cytochrome c-type heme lyase [Hondaea fermentalgiana]|eukprot:GBG26584.1 Cytochrome c-type heme lyase [Hondaea fermentalgiana]